MKQVERHYVSAISGPMIAIPEGKRVPFGWETFAVAAHGDPVILQWDNLPPSGTNCWLRLTVALDVREEKELELFLPDSGTVIGTMAVKYAYIFQPFEASIDPRFIPDLRKEGLGLRMVAGNLPLWLFNEASRSQPSTLFVPHFLCSEERDAACRQEAFLHRMNALDSIQEFSWMGGCVLDGLYDLEISGIRPKSAGTWGSLHTAQQHLLHFFDAEDRLVYENPRSEPSDGYIRSIEATLSFAVLAKIYPDHPSLELALSFWLDHQAEDGAILDGATLSAEGSYTIAYPLAVLARVRGRQDLAEASARQLLIRRDRLNRGSELYLRNRAGDYTFRHWARAYAWYMLGLTRSLIELEALDLSLQPDADTMAALREESVRITRQALGFQREDGLWGCFLDADEVAPDTSGSAGIAAALVLATRHGHVPESLGAREAGERTLDALRQSLTPDGLLTGVAQSNRGGEALQRGDYRVISQMGMGLMAQLLAAIGSDTTGHTELV